MGIWPSTMYYLQHYNSDVQVPEMDEVSDEIFVRLSPSPPFVKPAEFDAFSPLESNSMGIFNITPPYGIYFNAQADETSVAPLIEIPERNYVEQDEGEDFDNELVSEAIHSPAKSSKSGQWWINTGGLVKSPGCSEKLLRSQVRLKRWHDVSREFV